MVLSGIGLDDVGWNVAIFRAGNMDLFGFAGQLQFGWIEGLFQWRVVMMPAPFRHIQVGGHGDHSRDLRQVRGHQHGKHSAAAETDQDYVVKGVLFQPFFQRPGHAGNDFAGIALRRPVFVLARGHVAEAMIAGPAQQYRRLVIPMQQLQNQRVSGGWIGGFPMLVQPWRPIAVQVDMQGAGGFCISGPGIAEDALLEQS